MLFWVIGVLLMIAAVLAVGIYLRMQARGREEALATAVELEETQMGGSVHEIAEVPEDDEADEADDVNDVEKEKEERSLGGTWNLSYYNQGAPQLDQSTRHPI